MQADFSSVTSTNLAALDRIKKGVERLNERIMSAARDAAKKQSVNYGSGGNLTDSQRAVSVGLNESA